MRYSKPIFSWNSVKIMAEFDRTDAGLLVSALVANHADFATTRSAIGEGGEEYNPLFGGSPSKSKLVNLEIGTALGILALGLKAPDDFRRAALGAITGMKARLAYQNKKGGEYKGFADAMKKPALAGLAAGLLAHHFLNDEEKGVSVGLGALGPMSIKVEKKF